MLKSQRHDLHLHTNRSDGKFDPNVVLEKCAAGGLDVIAITDHDLPLEDIWGEQTIQGRTLRVIAGAEVSGMYEDGELHLLVYFPGPIPEGFRAFCATQVAERLQRYEIAVERLGIEIPPIPEDARLGKLSLTRHHLAREVVSSGRAADLREAFAKYVGQSSGMVPGMSLGFLEAIQIARSFGGLTSWAHPPPAMVQRLVPKFAAAGLQGIEALRPVLNSTERRKMKKLAKQYGLFVTAGSDWHGWCGYEPGVFAADPSEIQDFLVALAA